MRPFQTHPISIFLYFYILLFSLYDQTFPLDATILLFTETLPSSNKALQKLLF